MIQGRKLARKIVSKFYLFRSSDSSNQTFFDDFSAHAIRGWVKIPTHSLFLPLNHMNIVFFQNRKLYFLGIKFETNNG